MALFGGRTLLLDENADPVGLRDFLRSEGIPFLRAVDIWPEQDDDEFFPELVKRGFVIVTRDRARKPKPRIGASGVRKRDSGFVLLHRRTAHAGIVMFERANRLAHEDLVEIMSAALFLLSDAGEAADSHNTLFRVVVGRSLSAKVTAARRGERRSSVVGFVAPLR